MKKYKLFFLTISLLLLCLMYFSFIGCNNDSLKSELKVKEEDSIHIIEPSKIAIDKNDTSRKRFIENCGNFRTWIGSINSPKYKNILFPLGACYDKSESYDVIFIPKNIEQLYEKDNSLSVYFEKANNTKDYSGFRILVFVIPMLDPDLQDDISKDYTKYPYVVKIYSKNNDNWSIVGERKVINLKDFIRLKEYYITNYLRDF